MTDTEIQKIITLRKAGYTIRAIQKELNIGSTNTIHYHLHQCKQNDHSWVNATLQGIKCTECGKSKLV